MADSCTDTGGEMSSEPGKERNNSASIDPSLISEDDLSGASSLSQSEVVLPFHSSVIPSKSFPDNKARDESLDVPTKRMENAANLPSPIRRDSYMLLKSSLFDNSNLPRASSTADFPVEQADWLEVNNVLRDHGFNPILLTHPTRIRNSGNGHVVLDEHNAEALRHTLMMMVKDCDRRQGLVHELVASTRRLQTELEEEQQRAKLCQEQAAQYSDLLKQNEANFKAISNQDGNHSEQNALLLECTKLRSKLRKLKNENTSMKIEIGRTRPKTSITTCGFATSDGHVKEARVGFAEDQQIDYKHRDSQKKDSIGVCGVNNGAAQPSFSDDLSERYDVRLLQMETEIVKLRQQLKCLTSDKEHSLDKTGHSPEDVRHSGTVSKATQVITSQTSSSAKVKANNPDPNAKHSTQQPKEASLLNDSPKSDSNTLLGSKPSTESEFSDADEFCFLLQRLKIAEKRVKQLKKITKSLLKENHELKTLVKRRSRQGWRSKSADRVKETTTASRSDISRMPRQIKALSSSQVDRDTFDASPIPNSAYQSSTKAVLRLLGVTNLNEAQREIAVLQSDAKERQRLCQILCQVGAVLTVLPKQNDVIYNDVSVQLENEIIRVLSTWQSELSSGRDLHMLLLRLLDIMEPTQRDHHEQLRKKADTIRISDITYFLEDIVTKHQNATVSNSDLNLVSEVELRKIVEHFMRLFDVVRIGGVYTRMTDLYRQCSETKNILNAIKDHLDLEKNATSTSIVNAVKKLRTAKHLLHVENLESVVNNLEKYDEFYASFQTIITEIMTALGCDRMDEIVPSIRALIRFPQ